MPTSRTSVLLVLLQFTSIAVLLIGGGWDLALWSWLLFTAGLVLFVWAAWAMGRNFTVMPEPKPGNTLVRRGPYRWLRHPMYTAVIICAIAVTVGAPSAWRLLALAVCVPALVWKVVHEERRIGEMHADYQAAMRGTWRLFPFVW